MKQLLDQIEQRLKSDKDNQILKKYEADIKADIDGKVTMTEGDRNVIRGVLALPPQLYQRSATNSATLIPDTDPDIMIEEEQQREGEPPALSKEERERWRGQELPPPSRNREWVKGTDTLGRSIVRNINTGEVRLTKLLSWSGPEGSQGAAGGEDAS